MVTTTSGDGRASHHASRSAPVRTARQREAVESTGYTCDDWRVVAETDRAIERGVLLIQRHPVHPHRRHPGTALRRVHRLYRCNRRPEICTSHRRQLVDQLRQQQVQVHEVRRHVRRRSPSVQRLATAGGGDQLGVADVAVSKAFYVDRGFTVAKSYGRRYVEFDTGAVTPSLYKRALAKVAGVSRDGTGSHRLVVAAGARAFHRPRRVCLGGGSVAIAGGLAICVAVFVIAGLGATVTRL